MLSRPPLLLPSLTPLEQSYYAYQRRLHRALSKPLDASTAWFFKKGSASEKSFLAFDSKVEGERGDEDQLRAFELAGEEVEGAPKVESRELSGDKKGDESSLERKGDRTLYLLLKKDRKDNVWQFREYRAELLHPSGVVVTALPTPRVLSLTFWLPPHSSRRRRSRRVTPRSGSA